MMKTEYEGYKIETFCRKIKNGRYSVEVVIKKTILGYEKSEKYCDSGISLILEQEAEKEAINLAKNIIQRRIINF